ncbi:hypothetical protein RJ641_005338 [Dillenia turbinata]|uniref:Uncharacterized protein n=1 Tax=Dillenia turbinata TaxID=194707 RepID=A0AAN8ZCZ1_9MAGN
MGISFLRDFHVPGLLRQAQTPRRPHQLRPIIHNGLLARYPPQKNGSQSWWQLSLQFLPEKRGIPKETDIPLKYNSNAASNFQDKILTISENKHWVEPPIVKEYINQSSTRPPRNNKTEDSAWKWENWDDAKNPVNSNSVDRWRIRNWVEPPIVKEYINQSSTRPPRNNKTEDSAWKWENWDDAKNSGNSNNDQSIRRNYSVGESKYNHGNTTELNRCRSLEDSYGKNVNDDKESFFARKISENAIRPEEIPPSQGGKYVGFGSTSIGGSISWQSSQGDTVMDAFNAVSEGLGILSSAASSVVQSAANVVSKLEDGGYDDTMNAVASKTIEIGQRTLGIMRGVMAMAAQKLDELANEEGGSNMQRNENNYGNASNQHHVESRCGNKVSLRG